MKNVTGWLADIVEGTAKPSPAEIRALALAVKSALKSLREIKTFARMNADRALGEIVDASTESILYTLSDFLESAHALALMKARRPVREVFEYCKPHLSSMWAAQIVGILLECDFRDAASALALWEAQHPKEKLKCQDCGKEDETVSKGVCPFAEEIRKKIEPVILCANCYRNRARDI